MNLLAHILTVLLRLNCSLALEGSDSANPDDKTSIEHFGVRDGGWAKWGSWGPWSACSSTCGGGIRLSKRNSGGEGGCESINVQACNRQGCPQNGGWSGWAPWGACSKTCGGGTQQRIRICNSPIPANGGADCAGSSFESLACNAQVCIEYALLAGQSLTVGQYLESSRKCFRLIMQGDGNLVLYRNYLNTPIWSTGTSGANNRAVMQSDANFVVYNDRNVALWSSGTAGNGGGARLQVQDDGNFGVYASDNRGLFNAHTVTWCG